MIFVTVTAGFGVAFKRSRWNKSQITVEKCGQHACAFHRERERKRERGGEREGKSTHRVSQVFATFHRFIIQNKGHFICEMASL